MTPPDAADTIAAISTPLGEAGIGIVRLSGPRAYAIARRLFRPHKPRQPWRSHRLYLGHIVDPTGTIILPPTLSWLASSAGISGGAAVTMMASKGALSGQPL